MVREVRCCTKLSKSSGMVSGGSGTFSRTHHRCLQSWKTSWDRCLRHKRNASGDAGSAVDNVLYKDESKDDAAVKVRIWVGTSRMGGKNVYRASAQQATRARWAQTATTLPAEDRGSRHLEQVGRLTSDSARADQCTCARSHHAAASQRAPVSPLNRASPINLSGRDQCGFPHAVSLADGYRGWALWSGQRS
jgi:hypothetical protein